MIKIYHNPRCSKSRQSLDLILSKTKEVEIVEYIKNPPTKEELQEILTKTKLSLNDILRHKEDVYLKYIKDKDLTEEEVLDIITKHPTLLERPIVVKGSKAVIGRPPEKVLELFI